MSSRKHSGNTESRLLLSCVGMRDPYDANNRQFHGPVLAGVFAQSPVSVLLLCTPGTEARGCCTRDELVRLFPSIEVEIRLLDLKDPSDYQQVDLELRKALKELAVSRREVTVNLSPGTPQLSTTLSVLLATGFLNGGALKVSDPKFISSGGTPMSPPTLPQEYKPTKELLLDTACEVLIESQADAALRAQNIDSSGMPIVEHILRSNAVKLCESFDYHGAKLLLKESSQSKKYNRLARPLISLGESLFLLDIAGAKPTFDSIRLKLFELWPAKSAEIEKILNLPEPVILFLVTEQKKRLHRNDDFARCAGLTREVLISYYLNLEPVRSIYKANLAPREQGASGPECLIIKELELNNPALLNSIRAQVSKDPRFDIERFQRGDRLELTAWNGLLILKYAAECLLISSEVVDVLNKTIYLAGIRNQAAHRIKVLNLEERKNVEVNFDKLQMILPDQGSGALATVPALFETINEVLNELLLYWQN